MAHPRPDYSFTGSHTKFTSLEGHPRSTLGLNARFHREVLGELILADFPNTFQVAIKGMADLSHGGSSQPHGGRYFGD